MYSSSIEFKELKVPSHYGQKINRIFYVVNNDRSEVMEEFHQLSQSKKYQIKDLICKMATRPVYHSKKIKYNLKNYNYGEICPQPHRFFFFRKCGNNIIFFACIVKKTWSLSDRIYRKINEEKEIYEEEFRKYFEGSS